METCGFSGHVSDRQGFAGGRKNSTGRGATDSRQGVGQSLDPGLRRDPVVFVFCGVICNLGAPSCRSWHPQKSKVVQKLPPPEKPSIDVR